MPTLLRDFLVFFLREPSQRKKNIKEYFYTVYKNSKYSIPFIFRILALSWALLYLSENSDIQKKLQSEIDEVIGLRLPSVSDRVKYVFTF